MLEPNKTELGAEALSCESGTAGSRSWADTQRERRRVMKMMLAADARFTRCHDCRARLQLESYGEGGRSRMSTIARSPEGTNSTDLMNSKAHPVHLRTLLMRDDVVFLCPDCNHSRRSGSDPS